MKTIGKRVQQAAEQRAAANMQRKAFETQHFAITNKMTELAEQTKTLFRKSFLQT